ncbi:MAG: DUF5106 domain-containing protein [Bacteroidales bacterium]|nr:DUF5106 domain-containing protein [Bacteroidales bacterium]
MKRIFTFLTALILSANMANAQGYEIEVKIKSVPNDTLILGHHFNERLIPDDTIKLDGTGRGVFRGKEALPTGMYFIFLPNKNYFDFLIDKKAGEKFYIENDTANFLESVVIKNSLENQVFMDYQKFLAEKQKQFKELKDQYDKIKDGKNAEAKRQEIIDRQNVLNQEVDNKYMEQIKTYPDMFFSKFLTATRDITIPDNITDQTQRYYYYKNHFFDNFDISDGALLRTPIYQNKIERYIDQMVMQMPDSLIKETTWLVNKTRPKGKLDEKNGELFRFMLVYFFNKYAKSENMVAENVYCSLADIYIKDAFWDTDSFKTKLKERVAKKKNCLVGNISKDITVKLIPDSKEGMDALRPAIDELKTKGVEIEKAKPDFEARRNDVVKLLDDFINKFGKNYYSMHQMSAKYKLIVFWEPDCSHCKEELPKLCQFFKDTLSATGCEVFAIYMNKSVDNLADVSRHVGKCFDFLQEKGIYNIKGWHNMFNPFDQYRTNYDINSTPTIYLLNKDNEILAKRIAHTQAYDLIKYIEEEQKKQQK